MTNPEAAVPAKWSISVPLAIIKAECPIIVTSCRTAAACAPARVVNYVQQAERKPAAEWHTITTPPKTPSAVRLGVGDVTLHRFKFVGGPG